MWRGRLVVAAVAAASLTACGAAEQPSGGSQSAGQAPTDQTLSGQVSYQQSINADLQALFSGQVDSTSDPEVKVGQTTTVDAEVYGDCNPVAAHLSDGEVATNRCAQTTREVAANQTSGLTTPTARRIEVGGSMSATLSAPDKRVTVTSDGESARQSVVSEAQSASWSWTVSASAPGTYKLLLDLAVFDQTSDTALEQSPPEPITLTVDATGGYWLLKGWHVFLTVGVAISTLAGIGSAIGWLRKRRRRSRPAAA